MRDDDLRRLAATELCVGKTPKISSAAPEPLSVSTMIPTVFGFKKVEDRVTESFEPVDRHGDHRVRFQGEAEAGSGRSNGIPYANNPRLHSAADIDRIAASIAGIREKRFELKRQC